MRIVVTICLLVLLGAGGVIADEGPFAGPHESLLLKRLSVAPTESEGRLAESAVWEHWFSESPSTEVYELLQEGRKRREAYDYEAADALFNRVIEAAPDYAEGYNQRAFVRFLREDFEGSLADLEKTLEYKPWHFGALSGMYHVLRVQNRHSAAIALLRKAVAIHPWIQERGALPKELWPDRFRSIHEPGQEI